MTDWGTIAADRLAHIASASETGPGVTRLPFTSQHKKANEIITAWMEAAGMDVHLDATGTLIGRIEGPKNSGTFYMGSHQDSVREGGRFDGIMGVLLPILAMQKLSVEGVSLPYSVECLAFADEEGVRFPTALMGPRALAGTFDPAVLDMQDQEGISLRSAMSDFGLSPDAVATVKRSKRTALGYLETHIEQGPVLEDANQSLGIVTAICGIERHQIALTGETGHAGTLPMSSRRDALVGAAAIITEVNRLALATNELRGTVGALSLTPNVVNAVPGEVRMSIELRAPDDQIREAAGQHIRQFASDIATQHNLILNMERTYQQPAQLCAPTLAQALTAAVKTTGNTGLALPSGATHDASAMADLCPISMLFVRCRDGVSHVPEEYASPEDMAAAVNAICQFLKTYAGANAH